MQDRDDDRYVAVVNHEEQYSVWPEHLPIPDGWRPAGRHGTKEECLDFIEEVWTDMRPLSLRMAMEQDAQR
jgi:MbtH protein